MAMRLAVAAVLTGLAGAAAAQAASPTVVELYQSQGCSSCLPADANVNAIADRPGVLALTFSVTYWDKLGWKDTFGDQRYTDRQWDYARAWRRADVATPEVVINGRSDLVGNDARALDAAIRAAGAPVGASVALTTTTAEVAAGRAPAGGAEVWLVRYDPRTLYVAIRRGENGGKTLPHKDVVRELVKLGRWRGPAARFNLAASRDAALKTAVLVQAPDGGPILAAARL